MQKILCFSLTIAGLCALLLATPEAQAQSKGTKRALFNQKGCTQCHAFEARIGAPSIKSMQQKFNGANTKAAAAILNTQEHADELKSGHFLRSDITQLATLLAGESPSPAKLPSNPPKVISQTDAKPLSLASPAEEKKLQLKKEAEQAKQKREDELKAKKEAAALEKEEAIKAKKLAATLKSEAATQKLRETEAEAKSHTVLETENKTARELEAQKQAADEAAKKRADEELARREAENKQKAKQEAEAKSKRDAEAQAQAQAQAQAKRDAESKIKAEQLKKEAEASALTKSDKKIAYRDGSDLPPCAPPSGQSIGTVDEERAKAIMERIDCTGCHAYVQKKTGPPFKKVFEKYKGDSECVESRLRKNKTHNDEGVTKELKGSEFKIIADYIATRAK